MKNYIILFVSVIIIVLGLTYINESTYDHYGDHYVNEKDAAFCQELFYYLQESANDYTNDFDDEIFIKHSIKNKRIAVNVIDAKKFIFVCEREYHKFKSNDESIDLIAYSKGTQSILFHRSGNGYIALMAFYSVNDFNMPNISADDINYMPKEDELVLQALREMQDDGYDIKIDLMR